MLNAETNLNMLIFSMCYKSACSDGPDIFRLTIELPYDGNQWAITKTRSDKLHILANN